MTHVAKSAEILNGETADQHTGEFETAPDFDQIFLPMFDSYARLIDGPDKVASVSGRDPYTKNPTFTHYDKSEIAELRLADLRLYVKVAFTDRGLGIDPALVPEGKPITLENLAEGYIGKGILDARLRAQARGKLAEHVTVSEVDANPEETKSFYEIVKDFAKTALGRGGTQSQPAVHYHSGEIALPPTLSIPVDELEAIVRK